MSGIVLIDTEREGAPREHVVEAVEAGGTIWLDPQVVADVLGWTLRDEGLCRGDVCVPVRDRSALLRGGRVGIAPLAEALGRPLAVDAEGGVVVIGAAAADRAAALQSGVAPDVTLPDVHERLHTLSHHRGSKVLFVAYASW
jgi:hypothetical protein